ncbi:MAG: hypothetical protein AB8B86_20930 [Pseudomonadales bacterium]
MNSNNYKPELMKVEEVEAKETPNTSAKSAEKTPSAAKTAVEPAKEAEPSIPTLSADDDLGKVQELLFGGQLRAVNQKIILVHKDFKQSMSDLDRKIEQQMRDQETMVKKELNNVVEQLRAETKARESAVENAGMELRWSGNNLQDRISAMEKTHSAGKTSFENQLAQTQGDLERSLIELKNDLQSKLDGARNTLDDNKVYRTALSELLGGIAEQISSIDKIPTVTQRSEAANAPASPSNTRSA